MNNTPFASPTVTNSVFRGAVYGQTGSAGLIPQQINFNQDAASVMSEGLSVATGVSSLGVFHGNGKYANPLYLVHFLNQFGADQEERAKEIYDMLMGPDSKNDEANAKWKQTWTLCHRMSGAEDVEDTAPITADRKRYAENMAILLNGANLTITQCETNIKNFMRMKEEAEALVKTAIHP